MPLPGCLQGRTHMGNPAGRQLGGNGAVEWAQRLDEPVTVALHEHLPPPPSTRAGTAGCAELVGDHDPDDRPVGHDGDRLDAVRMRCR